MPHLVDALYPAPDLRRTPLSLLVWWESRRPLYNRVVGTAGLVTLAGYFVLVPRGARMDWPELVAVVLAYGVMANVCYTAGWLVELLARRVWGRSAPYMGPWLFREGLIFSVGLTLFPLLLLLLFTVGRVALALVS
jgi:hypothetical protein